MSTVIVAIVFLVLITAATVYSLKRRNSCSSCRRCPYQDEEACNGTPPGKDDGSESKR